MILISTTDKPLPFLRTTDAMKICQTGSRAQIEEYGKVDIERKRFYVIVANACNVSCWFCLCHTLENNLCSNADMRASVAKALRDFPGCVSVSITGGEPCMFPARLEAVLYGMQDARDAVDVRWVGIATNAVRMPPFDTLKKFADWCTFHFYISRHHDDSEWIKNLFGAPQQDLNKLIPKLRDIGATVMFTCNLYRGGIETPSDIARYCKFAKQLGITSVTFRELNRVSGETERYGPDVKMYVTAAEQKRIELSDFLPRFEKEADQLGFKFGGQTVRPYLFHEYWRTDGLEACFRLVNEEELRRYESSQNREDTERVIYPDGNLSTWDK